MFLNKITVRINAIGIAMLKYIIAILVITSTKDVEGFNGAT